MPNQLTINQLLVLMKEVRSRVNDLRAIRSSSAVIERNFYGIGERETRKETEPQYNVKAVDKKITSLENWLFKADSAIKQANAVTRVDVEVDVDSLLAPLE
jgi:hypothetical protein